MNKINFIFIILISLVIFPNITLASSKSCAPVVTEAPKCPTQGSRILDDSYPVSSALVSADQGVGFASQFVSKVMFSQKKPIPVLISATPEDFQKILKQIENDKNMTMDQRRLSIQLLKRVDPSGGDGENWQQDYFESQFHPATGLPVFKESGIYIANRGMRKDYFPNVSESLSSCGVSQGTKMQVDFEPNYFSNAMSGGNLEALPNGICLVGRGDFKSDRHLNSFAKSACGTEKFLEVPTEFLTVGHTDEIMNVIPDNTQHPPCNYAITMASPDLGLKLLKENPNAPMYSDSMLKSMTPEGDLQDSMRSFCKDVLVKKTTHERLNLNHPEDNLNSPGSVGKFNLIHLFINSVFALTVTAADHELVEIIDIKKIKAEVQKSIDSDAPGKCKSLTNQDLVDYYEKDDYDKENNKFKPSENKLVNQAIQRKLGAFKDQILKKTKNNKPSCSPKIMDVPYLFNGNYSRDNKTANNALSIFPNSTNGLRMGNKYIFPSAGNDIFGKYTTDLYQKQGMKTEAIDTFWAHSQYGNLHCSSHLLRYCNPR